MNKPPLQTMRDALIEGLCWKMRTEGRMFFLSADLGAPALDRLRTEFPDRFINVGIAEQNLANVATGLALEGFTVYAYAIASFLSMRAFEQIRVNLALMSQTRPLNVNLVGLGGGVSYDLSGPTHHCLEDLSIIRTLPNLMLLSPSDSIMAGRLADFSACIRRPKYIRLDGKPLPHIYSEDCVFDWVRGFHQHIVGDDLCIVATGYMTHKALNAARELAERTRIGVIDVFMLNPTDTEALAEALGRYAYVITLEEGFVGRGGLDSLVAGCLREYELNVELKTLGFKDEYLFAPGARESLYRRHGLGQEQIVDLIASLVPTAHST